MIFLYLFVALCTVLVLHRMHRDLMVSFIGAVAGFVFAIITFYGPMYWQASDYEVLSGSVAKKQRVYDPYTESYECGRDASNNPIMCQRLVPRWRWDVISDINETFEEYTSQAVRAPEIYARTMVGDPYASTKRFLNFQNVSAQTVFMNREAAESYVGWLPSYPQVFSGFKIVRAFSSTPIVDAQELGHLLALAQKRWGPAHGVNVIVVAVREETDFNAFYNALLAKWNGGKKNDAILIIRVLKNGKIANTTTITRSADELIDERGYNFTQRLHMAVFDIGQYDPDKLIETIDSSLKLFKREDLGRYDFLRDEYEPPFWLIGLSLAGIVLVIWLTVNKLCEGREWRRTKRRYKWN